MKGVVKNWNQDKKIGRISPEGGGQDFFFHQTDILTDEDRAKVGNGSQVEFEPVQPQPTQGPRAKEIKVRSSGQKAQPKTVTAEWQAGKPTLTDDRIYLMIPLWITLKQGDKTASGIKATLNTDGTQQTLPAPEPTSGPDGRIFFRVFLQPDTKSCDFLLSTPNQHHTYFWENKEEKAKPDQLRIKEDGRHVGDSLTFLVGCGGKPCKGNVKVAVKGSIQSMTDASDPSRSFDKPLGTFPTNDKGELTIKFDRTAFRIRITGTLENDESKSACCELFTV